MQIDSLMSANFTQPHHQISVIQSSHRILDNAPDAVRSEVKKFMDTCSNWALADALVT